MRSRHDKKGMKMTPRFFAAAFIVLLSGGRADAEFIGTLAFKPKGCESAGKCKIVADFKYIDPNKIGWLTKAGDITDGASIPSWAQPFIGRPFEKAFLSAAVIHDHYCDRHVRPWRQTHLVFYNALLESGVSSAFAKLMYFAVYLGGPKWVELIPGNSCGPGCEWMRAVALTSELPWSLTSTANIISEKAPKNLLVSAAEYDNPRFKVELTEVERMLKERGDTVDLKTLEERAKKIKPNDFYYTHNDAVSTTDVSEAPKK
ncbi:DUF1353 domain-containing protein [Methylocystis sp.]|uniref:DUF1353 domain-containing protein n=1 Tax=Methylocystis sp. TaxID=1911079 RepID=UPI003DA37351